jgi:small subunit ribosomal protein S16
MLVIRLQRTGRKGHAQYRVVVQESRVTPTSGRVVAQIGYYNPHNKEVVLQKEKAEFYLSNGAQPSNRVVTLFTAEGITLPKWVKVATTKERAIRNPEKLRRNQPAEVASATEVTTAETEAEEAASEVAAEDTVVTEEITEETAPEAPEEEKEA